MRKEPFTIGDFVHIYNRGNRKMDIINNNSDSWRFLQYLRYFNDEYSSQNFSHDLHLIRKFDFQQMFMWPKNWPPHKPLVKILSFCLMPNHFHLLLKETNQGGVSKFMTKLGTGFTNYTNTKYKTVGRLFQGSYKSRTINDVKYIQYLDTYIQILNPLEFYPGGSEKAVLEFDKAFKFANQYSFSSLPDVMKKRDLLIIDRDILENLFPDIDSYKKFIYDALLTKNTKEILGKLSID